MRGKNTRRVFSDVFRPAVFKTGDGLSLKNSLGPPANLSCLLVRNCTLIHNKHKLNYTAQRLVQDPAIVGKGDL